MAFTDTPTLWISSWSEDGTTASFDLADLTEELTAAEADAATGDWREIVWSILNHTYKYYDGLADENKPTKFTIEKSVSLQANDQLLNTFTVKVYTDYERQDLQDEA